MNFVKTRHPVFVISKGRHERCQTVKTLQSMGVWFELVVEPQEAELYEPLVDPAQLHVAPENFSLRGNGSIPVRNYVFETAIERGAGRHWILDDNIESVERYYNNMKIKCFTPAPFLAAEDFIDRYKNIGLAGFNYALFCPANEGRPPFKVNTRVYSCILVNNEIPYRWRGRYNEDTDLSLRLLKAGWNTILFDAFLIGKRATMTQGGGNEDIYKKSDNRREFALSLQKQHPDVVKVVWRYNRWHHEVNYKRFKRRLEYVDGYVLPKEKINNYGMKLIRKG